MIFTMKLTPTRLVISARDNPNVMEDSKMQKTVVMINVVTEDDLIILTVKNTNTCLKDWRRLLRIKLVL